MGRNCSGGRRRQSGCNRILPPMKNDPFFKFVAAVIIAGVIVALAAPSPTSTELAEQTSAALHAAGTSE